MERQYSGKVILRLPKDLHQRCSARASLEGCSLNTYLVQALAAATSDNAGVPVRATAKAKVASKKEADSINAPNGYVCQKCATPCMIYHCLCPCHQS